MINAIRTSRPPTNSKALLALLRAALVVALLAACGSLLVSLANAQAAFSEQPLVIETQSGPVEFRIEVADDPEERSRGLMFRRSMADDAGMLFVHASAREITMWMKNTYIPLDMIFIGDDGQVVSIAANTVPHSLAVVSSKVPAQYVLELNAGAAKASGIRVGDIIQHGAIQ